MARHRGLKTSHYLKAYSVEDVRYALQTMDDLDAEELFDLEGMLPENWRRLVHQCGRKKVFDCLRKGMTIGAAKFELITKQHL